MGLVGLSMRSQAKSTLFNLIFVILNLSALSYPVKNIKVEYYTTKDETHRLVFIFWYVMSVWLIEMQ
jgi:hypothetical protein